ncbi:unnamed protein product [Schistocephalus solidus]|uniref:DUF3699 domain-containing protein n=1 Tax=Schistocephalus solidus TaxID=70667 RepID=A0A183SJD6_SCHSO|nr:unnamed protein product [Schistocephalus solidus]
MKTCEGASVTTPPSTEKTDIGYLFICKEDKLMRIPIKLDVDRKEERYMQNASLGAYYSSFQKYAVICGYRGLFKISADCGAMKYLKSSKDLRFVSMRKKAMEEIDMDLKDLFENCDWVKVADGSLFKPCGEVAFNDDMRTHKMAENRCVPKVPVSDVSRQPNESSTYPRAEEALDYRTGFLTSQEAETRISTNQSSLKRPFMRMNSTKDATDNQMDQSRLGKSNLQRSPFESVKMCKSTAVPKSKTPPPAHHPGTATGTGGVVFRPAILTVPGLTPARLSSCWTSPANAIFQLETPLDCHRENNNLLLGSAQNFCTVGGPEAAMTAAVAMKPVHQPKLDSQVV